MPLGIATGFVRKLYRILDHESDAIISWDPSGASFSIHNSEKLNEVILPRYFRGRLSAFRQQLIDHGFQQLECEDNENRESYRHDHFQRGCPDRLSFIVRNPKPKRKQQGKKSTRGVQDAPTQTQLPLMAMAGANNGMQVNGESAFNEAQPATMAPTAAGAETLIVPLRLNRTLKRPPAEMAAVDTASLMHKQPRTGSPSPVSTPVNGSGVMVNGSAGMSGSVSGSSNPLFASNDDGKGVAVSNNSLVLPRSSDLPEPISYLTRTPSPVAPSIDSGLFSEDMIRSAMYFLVSASTTGVDTTTRGARNGEASAKPAENSSALFSSSSNILSTLNENPLFSSRSSSLQDGDNDIWNLIVASSVDKVKTALNSEPSAQGRIQVIIRERERLEEQRKRFLGNKSCPGAEDSRKNEVNVQTQAPSIASVPNSTSELNSEEPVNTENLANMLLGTSSSNVGNQAASSSLGFTDDRLLMMLFSSSVDCLKRSAADLNLQDQG